jgi:hypothetical protein
MSGSRVIPVKVITCRKPVPGILGGGIFCFRENNKTEYGSFFFDVVYWENAKLDPKLISSQAEVNLDAELKALRPPAQRNSIKKLDTVDISVMLITVTPSTTSGLYNKHYMVVIYDHNDSMIISPVLQSSDRN